jgi:hypothetical protein
MNGYTKNEFYGDLIIYKIEKWRKLASSWLFYILALLFVVVFIGLSLQPEKTSALLNGFANYAETEEQQMGSFKLLAAVGLVIILIPFLPTMLHVVRKYWLYPKKSLTLQAFCAVNSKELILHPKTRNSSVQPKTHYLKVQHPRSGRLVPVDVDGEWFNETNQGEQVNVHYHQSEDNILYLRKPGSS